jgi:hypothetical protein
LFPISSPYEKIVSKLACLITHTYIHIIQLIIKKVV